MLETGRKIKIDGPARTDRRDECRTEVFLRTMVAHGLSGHSHPVAAELVNVSMAGFLIRTKGRFRDGDRFQIALPKLGYIRAKVVWSLKGCAGGEFLTSLEEGEFAHMLQAIKRAQPGWLEALPKS